MDQIFYAGETLTTGTEIAAALLEYAQALAGAEKSDTVDIPIRSDDGTIGRATLVIGPASQLVAIAAADDIAELEDADVVATLRQRAAALGTRTAIPSDSSAFPASSLDELDL